jgi:hypothetical protein
LVSSIQTFSEHFQRLRKLCDCCIFVATLRQIPYLLLMKSAIKLNALAKQSGHHSVVADPVVVNVVVKNRWTELETGLLSINGWLDYATVLPTAH